VIGNFPRRRGLGGGILGVGNSRIHGRQFLKIRWRKTCITLNYRNEDWFQGFYQEMVWTFKGNRKGSFPGTNDELEQRREQVSISYIFHFFGGQHV